MEDLLTIVDMMASEAARIIVDKTMIIRVLRGLLIMSAILNAVLIVLLIV